ncbi:purine-nucleoside phosphorylase [Alkalispirochaeta americana]|uniref:Uridine phosphorylase n=1 Tax=Alkalispirochaeta americana TaxID=159291 RepID=A0A1N6QBI4_9SPIO|nr:purine-nucleoside phosphorylase [Alkalispirochaeta americana]SIQ13898.1 purine-nucleoside phosphorylase [Alkalispirochaeta americana]
MSTHIGAQPGEIAETVLMPGDPLRAQFVAENWLSDVHQYNNVRGMLGFTGLWKGERISVQGSGMGMPSMAIYATELMRFFGVQRLIRIGSCGSMQSEIALRELILAVSASTNSAMNRSRFGGMDYAATASWNLLRKALAVVEEEGIPFHAGSILSSDTFYDDDPSQWKVWARHGVLAVEMEANQLYTLAARHGREALALLTVSDSLVQEKELSAQDRQTGFHQMVEVALEVARRAQAEASKTE